MLWNKDELITAKPDSSHGGIGLLPYISKRIEIS